LDCNNFVVCYFLSAIVNDGLIGEKWVWYSRRLLCQCQDI